MVAYTPTGAERADAGASGSDPWVAMIVGTTVGPSSAVNLVVFAPDGNVFARRAAVGRGPGSYDPSEYAVRSVRPSATLRGVDGRLDALDSRVDTLESGAEGVEGLHRSTTATVTTADATNQATAITLANALRAAYEAHRADATAHLAADTSNGLTAPAASDGASLYALVNDLKLTLNEGHFIEQPSHVGVLPGQLYAIDDLRFPAQAINPSGGGTFDADVDDTTGLLLFDDGREEYAAITAQMPHAWAAGSPIDPHVHWLQDAAGGVAWRLDYAIVDIGDTLASFPPTYASLGPVSAGVVPYTSGVVHQLTPLGTLDMSGYGESTMLLLRLARVDDNPGDTKSGDAIVMEFDIHYRKDKFGTVDTSPAEAGVFPVGIQGARAVTAIEASNDAQAVILVNELKQRLNEHLVA